MNLNEVGHFRHEHTRGINIKIKSRLNLCLQDLLSSFSQLYHSCCSTIDWLEQEVSTHRSHVIALRSELEDVCLLDNLASVPVRCFTSIVLDNTEDVQGNCDENKSGYI